MGFVKFPKVANANRKDVMRVLAQYPGIDEELWVAQEKLDGANIQIELDEQDQIRVYKRSGLADGDFYNLHEVLSWQSESIVDLVRAIADETNTCTTRITLCGELFGDGVQKRIDYGRKRFMFFDVKVDQQFILFPDALMESNLFVDFVKKGTLNELLEMDVENMSSAYAAEGAQGERAMAEGVVLKPLFNRYVDKGYGRLIQFKLKSSRFGDNKPSKKGAFRAEAPSERARELSEQAEAMVNENRLADLFSKHGEIQDEGEIGHYIKLFNEDIAEDLDLTELDKKERKFVMNNGAAIAKLLKKHLAEG